MQSNAATVDEYIAQLPPDRAAAISAVREVILKNLDKGYAESMAYGMIGYNVPHSIYPAGYHCNPQQPLPYAGLASQKNHMSLYLMSCYCDPAAGEKDSPRNRHAQWFIDEWTKTGKKLDMGKACIRFKKLDDIPLPLIGEAIRRVPVKQFIEQYESALQGLSTRAKKPAPAKASTPSKAAAAKNSKKVASKGAASKKVGSNKTGPNKTSSKKTGSKKTGSKKTSKK